MSKLLFSLYESIHTHKLKFGLILIAIFGLLIWMTSTIRFDEDISKLIPSNDENEQLQKVLNTAHFSDKIIINIKKKSDGQVEDLTEYAQQFLDSLNKNSSKYIKAIQGKVEDSIIFEALDFVYENAPLFLKDEDYEIISNKLNTDSIHKLTEANYKILVSPSGIIAKQTIVKDPLGISILGVKHLRQLGFNDNFELKEGFLVSKNGQNLLLFITPTFSSSETNENELFATQIYELQSKLNVQFKDKVSSEAFGGTLIAVANAKQIKEDIQLTITIALVALLLLFVFFYRKLSIPIILMIPTLFAGLFAAALLSIIRDEISAISLGIGAVLIGITLDYSLHILTHIRNNHDIKELYADVTKPILMSSLTTALAFLCLLFIDSQALQDLGIFAAMSVIGASGFALIFIPQVYKNERIEVVKRKTFIDKIAKYDFDKNKLLITGIIILLIASVFTYQNVTFNKDISKLNYQPQHLFDAEKNLEDLTNERSKSIYIITFGNNPQQVLKTNDIVFKKLQEMEAGKKIISFNSVGALVTSEASQQNQIDRWNRFWTSEKVNQVEDNLIISGKEFGFKPTTFQAFYSLLTKDFKPLDPEDFKIISTIPLDDFMANKNDFYTITSLVKVEDNQIPFVKKSFNDASQMLVIDRQDLNESLLGQLKNDFNDLIVYCFAVVFLLLLVFYRNIKLTLVTIIPIIITWFITIGIMGIFKMEFNIFSILISTFIFGLGVDYCIFMTNGLIKNKDLPTYKTSVILSVLTTILGIGVLIFAKHPALYSISIVSTIGILTAMLIAFTIQPILFKLLIFGKKQIKNEQD